MRPAARSAYPGEGMADPSLRNVKENRLLHLIYRTPEITRGTLGAQTGLNSATVVRIVAELRALGLITAHAEGSQERPGRPTEVLAINSDAGYVIGLELGRRALVAVVADARGQVRHVENSPQVPPFTATETTMDQLVTVARAAASDSGIPWASVRGVGLALHDVVSSQGEWALWGNPLARPFAARAYLAAQLGLPVAVEDVSRAFAEAEHRFGAGRGAPDMMYVFIGADNVGAGFFVNDTPLRSATGVCGEIGHVVVQDDGPRCQCGNYGCFEAVASQSAMVRRYEHLRRQGVATFLQDATVEFAAICEAAGAGDKAAHLVLNELATYLGKALASAVNLSGATRVLIGGQLRHAGAGFTEDLKGVLRRRVIPPLVPYLGVMYAALPEHAGAWGAALQVLDTVWNDGHFFSAVQGTATPQ